MVLVLLMMGVHYMSDFTACRLIIMTTPSSCSSSFPLYMMRWSEAVLILLAPVHRHSLIPQNLYPSISLSICAVLCSLYMVCAFKWKCFLVVPTNLVESWISFKGFHSLVIQVPPTCMANLDAPGLWCPWHLPFIRCSLHEVRYPLSATRGTQHLVVQPQPKRRFEEQERCCNIVSSLWRIQCCCCCHMFIASVLVLCCFHEIYIAAGGCVFVVVCFMLLVVTGLILLLQWLSCCHQVSVILNEISLLHVIWYVRWFVEVVLCFVFFACFILTFTCTCTCKYVAGTYSTFIDSTCLKVVWCTHYFMFYAWGLLL